MNRKKFRNATTTEFYTEDLRRIEVNNTLLLKN